MSSLINVQLGHVTHLGQFSLLAELMLAHLTQLEISRVLTCLGLLFLASIITLKRI